MNEQIENGKERARRRGTESEWKVKEHKVG